MGKKKVFFQKIKLGEKKKESTVKVIAA